MSLVQSVKTLAEEENNKALSSVLSNSTLLQKRIQLLAPSDEEDNSDTDTEEQVTPKKETPTRHNRSNSWLNWFSWYSNTTKPRLAETPPTPETSTPKHEISSPYQVEHTIHLDLSPESSSNSIKDISILIFEQKERIKDLQRDNDLKDEYIKQLEAKVREMHEQKIFAKERHNKLKQKYDELTEKMNGNCAMWKSVASSVLGVNHTNSPSGTEQELVAQTSPPQEDNDDDDSANCFTITPLKRNNHHPNELLSPTPDLDALLDKMANLDD